MWGKVNGDVFVGSTWENTHNFFHNKSSVLYDFFLPKVRAAFKHKTKVWSLTSSSTRNINVKPFNSDIVSICPFCSIVRARVLHHILVKEQGTKGCVDTKLNAQWREVESASIMLQLQYVFWKQRTQFYFLVNHQMNVSRHYQLEYGSMRPSALLVMNSTLCSRAAFWQCICLMTMPFW